MTRFPRTTTRGFAGQEDPNVAVCLRPGTEIAFEKEAQSDGMIFRNKVGDRLARFRQIDTDKTHQHHDALEFSNGKIVFLTNLTVGQTAIVLQLPATPLERPAVQEAAEPNVMAPVL